MSYTVVKVKYGLFPQSRPHNFDLAEFQHIRDFIIICPGLP